MHRAAKHPPPAPPGREPGRLRCGRRVWGAQEGTGLRNRFLRGGPQPQGQAASHRPALCEVFPLSGTLFSLLPGQPLLTSSFFPSPSSEACLGPSRQLRTPRLLFPTECHCHRVTIRMLVCVRSVICPSPSLAVQGLDMCLADFCSSKPV